MQPFDNLKLYYAATRQVYVAYLVAGVLNVALVWIFRNNSGAFIQGVLRFALFLGIVYGFVGVSGVLRSNRFRQYLTQPEHKVEFFHYQAIREHRRRMRGIGMMAMLFFASLIFCVYFMVIKKSPFAASADEITFTGTLLGVALQAFLNVILLWRLQRQGTIFLRGWV